MRLNYKNFYIAIVAVLLILCGCKKEEEDLELQRYVIIVPCIDGVGDNGYVDHTINDLLKTLEEMGADYELTLPKDKDDISRIMKILSEDAEDGEKGLLIMLGSDYESILTEGVPKIKGVDILFADAPNYDAPQDFYTLVCSRYGLGYLSGRIARQMPKAEVLAANDYAYNVNEWIKGFEDGFDTTRIPDSYKKIYFITEESDSASNFNPYNAPLLSYLLSFQTDSTFFLPLAGSSNNGVYLYLREPNKFLYAAGVDRNCKYVSTKIPFSLVLDLGVAIGDWVKRWYKGDSMPRTTVTGLFDGTAKLVFNDRFCGNDGMPMSDLESWKLNYDEYLQEAIEKDKNYLKIK